MLHRIAVRVLVLNATILSATTGAELNTALLSSISPRIIQLMAPSGSTYILDATYSYSAKSLCIEVRCKALRTG